MNITLSTQRTLPEKIFYQKYFIQTLDPKWVLIQVVPKKTGICGKLSLSAIELSKSKKLAHFWKIQEIL